MNVFILCTGRSGSMTFIKACNFINNYNAAHESRTNKIGAERLNYPECHIEADNRLSWFLGSLDKRYGNNAYYVHLIRDKQSVVESFSKRYNQGIIKGFRESILNINDPTINKEICEDYYDTVNDNIKVFLKDKKKKITINLSNIKDTFPIFWNDIKAVGDLDKALMTFNQKYNSSDEFYKRIQNYNGKSIISLIKFLITKYKLFRKLYFLFKPHKKNQDANPIQKYINSYIRIANHKVRFIQIGGCDGISNDPIHSFVKKYDWSGIILEPQENVFNNQLKRAYKHNKNIKLINAALDYTPGYRKLYKLSFSKRRWAIGLSTFIRSKLEDNIESGYVKSQAIKYGDIYPKNENELIIYEKVKCITLNDVLQQFPTRLIDFFVIDTEGFDFEIIKMLDFGILKPNNIIYEHSCLSPNDKSMCENMLIEEGYNLIKYDSDTIAVLKT